ncbi:UNVERIFIED_CONTAM: nitroreductase family protein [Prevotella sp. 15_C9]
MTLTEILEHRRAIRHFDPEKPLDTERVKECLKMATLAPTSSNMQLWECYHVTDKTLMAKLTHACLGQLTAKSAQQMVVFVTRQDRYKAHAKAVMEFEAENTHRHSPEEKQAKRVKKWNLYYGKLMPFIYSRFLGVWGLLRKLLAQLIGLSRPIVRQVSEADMRVVVHKSCALAVQTFMLAMSEAGYDTCPLEGFDSRLVKRALGLPCDCEINMIITCGIRLPDGVWGDRFRVPFSETYHYRG